MGRKKEENECLLHKQPKERLLTSERTLETGKFICDCPELFREGKLGAAALTVSRELISGHEHFWHISHLQPEIRREPLGSHEVCEVLQIGRGQNICSSFTGR